MRTGPAIFFAVSAFVLLLSLPTIPEQIRGWAEALGMIGAEWHWWNYLGVSIGLIMMLFSLYPVWRWVAGNASALTKSDINLSFGDILGIASMLVMVCLIGWGVYYIIFVYERPQSPVWVHPTLPPAEQEKAKAKCRIAAYEAIGAGTGKPSDPTPWHRNSYVDQCLIARGFKIEQGEPK